MKIKKGDAGYIRKRLKNVVIKTCLEFGIALALLGLGIWQTGDRLNLLTVVAILGCLPASKALVEWIMIAPHRSIEKEREDEIKSIAPHLTCLYDMVFTSEKKIMPVESIVIFDNTVCGYTSSAKVDTNGTAEHLKKYLSANKCNKVSVKIFDNYAAYLKRMQEMNDNAIAKDDDIITKEALIRQVILSLSL